MWKNVIIKKFWALKVILSALIAVNISLWYVLIINSNKQIEIHTCILENQDIHKKFTTNLEINKKCTSVNNLLNTALPRPKHIWYQYYLFRNEITFHHLPLRSFLPQMSCSPSLSSSCLRLSSPSSTWRGPSLQTSRNLETKWTEATYYWSNKKFGNRLYHTVHNNFSSTFIFI